MVYINLNLKSVDQSYLNLESASVLNFLDLNKFELGSHVFEYNKIFNVNNIMSGQHHHRPTLKQTNKKFKSKTSSKRSTKAVNKGRISTKDATSKASSTNSLMNKQQRKNHSKQLQKQKRDHLISSKRIFEGRFGAPRIILLLPLTDDIDNLLLIKQLLKSSGEFEEHDEINISGEKFANFRYKIKRFNQSLQIISTDFPTNSSNPSQVFQSILDVAKIADYIIPILSATNEVSEWGETSLRCIQAQGCSEVFGVIQGLSDVEKKEETGIRYSLLSFLKYFFPYVSKLSSIDQLNELSNTLRSICTGTPKTPSWREYRTYMVTEDAEWDNNNDDGQYANLKLTGVIRGEILDSNRLIHIPSSGDYQIDKITSAPHPSQLSSRPNGNTMSVDDENETKVIAQPNEEEQDDLISENEANTMENEQTWPTEEEMANGEMLQDEADARDLENSHQKQRRKVPKGTSSYQATWIIDSEDDDDSDDSDDDSNAGEEDESQMELQDDKPRKNDDDIQGGEEEEEVEMDERNDEDFEDLDPEEEDKQYKEYLNAEREDAEFPDEIDTPLNIPARERFARYRGLKSFRTSPWDPYENLPIEMSKVFEFENYDQMSKRLIKRIKYGNVDDDEQSQLTTVAVGSRVTIHLKSVNKNLTNIQSMQLPLIVFGLMVHEKKLSVVNLTVQRDSEYNGIVKSKDPLTAIIGHRKFEINPLYSTNTPKGLNNVHKFERYFRHGDASVATIFAPVTWGKCPVLFLKERENGKPPYLVATGIFKDADPTRIVAKRIILSGHPFKVHKKTSTIRYMFFNADDVAYFKPIELHTKYGRVGHIAESLGTHGYFKAHFDGPVTQMDTVLLYLYKRSFPKFSKLRIEGEQHISNDDHNDDGSDDKQNDKKKVNENDNRQHFMEI